MPEPNAISAAPTKRAVGVFVGTAYPRILGNPLSAREKQVVALVKQGKLNKEIAYELNLTTGTIKEYMWSIFRKLGVSNRVELALLKDAEV